MLAVRKHRHVMETHISATYLRLELETQVGPVHTLDHWTTKCPFRSLHPIAPQLSPSDRCSACIPRLAPLISCAELIMESHVLISGFIAERGESRCLCFQSTSISRQSMFSACTPSRRVHTSGQSSDVACTVATNLTVIAYQNQAMEACL